MREADERELSEPLLRARPCGRVPAGLAVKERSLERRKNYTHFVPLVVQDRLEQVV
jgi:hypothetical protein